MGILGITNRTENWKTASSFAPFFVDAPARRNLANRLLEPLGEHLDAGEVQIELVLVWDAGPAVQGRLGK